MLRVALPPDRYQSAEPRFRQRSRNIVEQIRAIPGVASAAASTRVPMWGPSIDIGVRIDGRARPDSERWATCAW